MAVKKAFQPIVDFLNENADKKVKSILGDLEEMCSAKGAGGSASTFHKDPESGEVLAIKDYYYGQWMPLSHVEFGKKANSASGFNTMSKEGVSNWSRQQREYSKAKEQLLGQVATGEVSPDQIHSELEKLEEQRKRVIPRADGIGFDTLEDCLNADVRQLDNMVAAAEDKGDSEEEAAE